MKFFAGICIGYYTVDCTIPKYILTIAQMTSILEEPIGEFNMVNSSWHETKFISVLYSQLYNYLFIINVIQLFKETVTFKLHCVLIVLPCKQQNVTNIRFLNYRHLPLKRTSSYKNTHTVDLYTE